MRNITVEPKNKPIKIVSNMAVGDTFSTVIDGEEIFCIMADNDFFIDMETGSSYDCYRYRSYEVTLLECDLNIVRVE